MLIQVDHIHFTYPGGVKALDDVSLMIQPGEKVALIGENGSGKTTLARHLNGLLRPQSGSIRVGDWQTTQHSPAKLAQRVAYVFQNPDEQLFRQRVWDEVAFGPQNLGCRPEQVRDRVEHALALMELSAVSQINPRDLGYSGRKRVALASAIAMQTPVLIFDEPTAGLDACELEMLSQVLRGLPQDKTVIVITHDVDFVAENLDRIIMLDKGRVTMDAEAQEFFGYNHQMETYCSHLPQMIRLSRRLGQANLALKVDQFLKNLIR